MKSRSRSAREDVLSRIKIALSGPDRSTHGANERAVVRDGNGSHIAQPSEGRSRSAASRSALVEQFKKELSAVGGALYRASNAGAACDRIIEVASSHKTRVAIGWNVALIEEIGLVTRLETANIQFVTCAKGGDAEDFAELAASADVGVTAVDYALADTGTLVLRSGSGQARSVSLLPPVHIALVKPDQFIPGLDELFPLLADQYSQSNGTPDSALTFITGPSRTADIELTLVVGVHGPQELHVILLDKDD